MPHSDDMPAEGQTLAVAAESLFLVNLLLVPGLGFAVLLVLYLRRHKRSPALAVSHLEQTLVASLWAGVLIIVANGIILLLGGYDSPHTWMVVIIYFTVIHSTLVLLGVVGLSKAMAGQCWRFPILGKALPAGCDR